ncbi:hypothetical protein L5470_01535 [Synechococcus sp. PCC 6717]|jgi:hypothetical protein|nr:hypothetical protein [Thermostichus lividus]MCI3279674.1 hypothetical protein [Synechococcus sp. PCC 6717]
MQPDWESPSFRTMEDVKTPSAPSEQLTELALRIRTAAQQAAGDVVELLALLRLLEELHRDICDNQFQAVLPTNRQALYKLLREIERNGGWPYIPRKKLEAFLAAMDETPDEC